MTSPPRSSLVGGASSSEEETERGRAHVLRPHAKSAPGADAHADEHKQRLDEDRKRNIGADLAALPSPLEERGERRGEARLGWAPLAQEDDEVLADRDEGARRAREALVDRNLVEIRLRQAQPCLLVCRRLERPKQGLATGEVAVERSARYPGGGCDVPHAGGFASGKHTRRCGDDVPAPRPALTGGHQLAFQDTNVISSDSVDLRGTNVL